MQYQNPIIPGFYPDPCICRVEDDYYLVNSSFEFFPGVPLWHSKDLISWNQIGYILTRDSQLPLQKCGTSCGIYAPTLRYHDGRFYMVTTNVSGGGNFYVWADDIRGPWSEPVYVEQQGIDPSLFWDDDGTVYFASTHFDENGVQCIGQCTIDITTGRMLEKTRPIWYGTGGKHPEGPHMYRIGGYYYLMIAEGGTEYGHMETIARSTSPWGPFESCPDNPILTHNNLPLCPEYEFQGLGHADLTEDPAGQWWIVFHGFRPSHYMQHHMGRETMIAPVEWNQDGWPVVNGGKPITNPVTIAGRDEIQPFVQKCWDINEDFDCDELSAGWSYLRNPVRENYSLRKYPGFLTLKGAAATLDDQDSPTFAGRRQQCFDAVIETAILPRQLEEGASAGLTVFHTAEHHYDLILRCRNGQRFVFLRRRVVDMITESEPVQLPESGKVYLKIQAERMKYSFYAGPAPEKMQLIGTGCTRLMASECMDCTFTGCFYGLFAEGECEASFDGFSVKSCN